MKPVQDVTTHTQDNIETSIANITRVTGCSPAEATAALEAANYDQNEAVMLIMVDW